MKNKIIVKPLAKDDIIAAYLWYEKQRTGLGDEFINEIDSIYNRIISNPFQFPKIKRNYRKAVIRRFPFNVIFIIEEKIIFILAVFHANRNPDIWKKRK